MPANYFQTTFDNPINYFSCGNKHGPKHIARCTNGVIWQAIWTNNNIAFFYSTNNGTTFTWAGAQSQIFDGQITHSGAFSFVIDDDDYLHLVYERYTGNPDARTSRSVLTYRRATLSADRQSITGWIAQQEFSSDDYWHNPDIVAFKMPGTNVTWIHVTASYNWSGDNRQILLYARFKWTGGTFTIDAAFGGLHDVTGAGTYNPAPSIMFRHNGNTKTPQMVGGSYKPDLWITYQLGTRQYLIDIPYNTTSGTWPSHSIEQLDATYSNWGGTTGAINYPLHEHHRWVNALYSAVDNKVVVFGCFINTALSDQKMLLFERSADNPGAGNWGRYDLGTAFFGGQALILRNGNIWFLAKRNSDNQYFLGKVSRQGGSRTIVQEQAIGAAPGNLSAHIDLDDREAFVQYAWNGSDSGNVQYRGFFNSSNHFAHAGGTMKQIVRYVKDSNGNLLSRSTKAYL